MTQVVRKNAPYLGKNSPFEKLMPNFADALRAHACANVEIEVIDNSAHYAADEQPDAVAQLIETVCLVITTITKCYGRHTKNLRTVAGRERKREPSNGARRARYQFDITKSAFTRISGENRMKRETVKMMASWALALALALSTARNAQAQDAKNPYPSMAPIEKYLMDRGAEVALARSAAPSSISRDATVVILGKNGYETAVEGKNRLCLHCRARLDEFIQQLRVLEPYDSWRGVLQSPGRAYGRAVHLLQDKISLGGKIES
ncbi:hypothetical protein [Edaphobacter aggregans]|uniref:hypothetical protein n=1 Tax=Edaphobacter aggregans TaxID=570835 RepID=UPI001C8CE170|nr:hypothetical protein [Edaphobacter aggregans]